MSDDTETRAASAGGPSDDFVTMTIDGQLFGVPVAMVQDVLRTQSLTRVPLAPSEIAGVLNLRGRIVTAIDVRRRLGLPDLPDDRQGMSVVVDVSGELYSLIVDQVGEVLTLPSETFDRNPSTLDAVWQGVSKGVYRLEGELLVVMEVNRLLDFQARAAA